MIEGKSFYCPYISIKNHDRLKQLLKAIVISNNSYNYVFLKVTFKKILKRHTHIPGPIR